MSTSPDAPRTPRSPDDLDRELEALLLETERTVERLKQELAERRAGHDVDAHGELADLSDDEREALQHAEIERLEEHLAHAKIRWEEVRAFFEQVLRDLISRGGSAVSGSEAARQAAPDAEIGAADAGHAADAGPVPGVGEDPDAEDER